MVPSLIEIDRALAGRSLYEFVKLAWPYVETAPYVDGWHIKALCGVFERVSRGELKRVVINVPPGSTKSKLSGVFWPAWDAIYVNPSRRWMYASFDNSLLNQDSQRLINLWLTPWFVERWGAFLRYGRPNVSEIVTTKGGVKFSTSFGGRGTGRHCDIQVIDDPIKPRDANGGAAVTGIQLKSAYETIGHTFASRARDPKTFARVLIMQRVHEDDPSAKMLAEGWEHVCFPMRYDPDAKVSELTRSLDPRRERGEILCPGRWTDESLREQEKNATVWATQYQQQPAPPGGTIVHETWIDLHTCTMAEANAKRGRVIQSWDLAFKDADSSDFVAAGLWVVTYEPNKFGKIVPHYWLRDFICQRLSFTSTCAEILARQTSWPVSEVAIEDKANGPACENTLKSVLPVGMIKLVNPLGSKTGRFQAVSPEFAGGQVHLPRDHVDFGRIRRVLTRYPAVSHDDEVDQVSQAILRLRDGGKFAAAMDRILGHGRGR